MIKTIKEIATHIIHPGESLKREKCNVGDIFIFSYNLIPTGFNTKQNAIRLNLKNDLIYEVGIIKRVNKKSFVVLYAPTDKVLDARYIRHQYSGIEGNEFRRLRGYETSWASFIFPIMRNIFPSLIASSFINVQPMTAPVGSIFYQTASNKTKI